MSSIINMGKIMGEVLLRVNGRLDPLISRIQIDKKANIDGVALQ